MDVAAQHLVHSLSVENQSPRPFPARPPEVRVWWWVLLVALAVAAFSRMAVGLLLDWQYSDISALDWSRAFGNGLAFLPALLLATRAVVKDQLRNTPASHWGDAATAVLGGVVIAVGGSGLLPPYAGAWRLIVAVILGLYAVAVIQPRRGAVSGLVVALPVACHVADRVFSELKPGEHLPFMNDLLLSPGFSPSASSGALWPTVLSVPPFVALLWDASRGRGNATRRPHLARRVGSHRSRWALVLAAWAAVVVVVTLVLSVPQQPQRPSLGMVAATALSLLTLEMPPVLALVALVAAVQRGPVGVRAVALDLAALFVITMHAMLLVAMTIAGGPSVDRFWVVFFVVYSAVVGLICSRAETLVSGIVGIAAGAVVGIALWNIPWDVLSGDSVWPGFGVSHETIGTVVAPGVCTVVALVVGAVLTRPRGSLNPEPELQTESVG